MVHMAVTARLQATPGIPITTTREWQPAKTLRWMVLKKTKRLLRIPESHTTDVVEQISSFRRLSVFDKQIFSLSG
jgi:hypothetical protein